MVQLVHGGDIYTASEQYKGKILDYSANINPLGVSEGVKKAISQALDDCVNYPDPLCRTLRKKLAEKLSLPESFITVGNGAADLIFRLVLALQPKNAVLLAPTFAEYESALNVVGCRVTPYYLEEENGYKLGSDFLDALTSSVDMVFLCNPNNPTGQLIEEKLLLDIVARCKKEDIFLVVDECFLDFLEEPERRTLKPCLKDAPNLFLLRAFTKSYAMPGLRLGYGLCGNEEVLERIFQMGQPWSVSIPAQEAGIQALEEGEYLAESRALIFRERERLTAVLSDLGHCVYPPAANYIFFRVDKGKSLFGKEMAEEGILVRSCANYRGLEEGYYRIAVRAEAENDVLIGALERREAKWQKQL